MYRRYSVFAGAVWTRLCWTTLTNEGRVESLRVAEITASALPLTRVPPLLGRPLAQGGDAVERKQLAVEVVR